MVILFIKGVPVGPIHKLPNLPKVLAEAVEVEFRTVEGQRLGYFARMDPPQLLHAEELTEEELNRIIADGGGSSLTDFWRRMGVLPWDDDPKGE